MSKKTKKTKQKTTEEETQVEKTEELKRPKLTANSRLMKKSGFIKAADSRKAEYILTNHYNFDNARGLPGSKGYKKGSTVTIYGPSLSGKSTLVYSWMGEWQRQGLVGALINLEDSWDPEWAAKQGADPDALYMTEVPEFADVALQQALDALEGKYFDFLVLDSLHAVGTKREIDRDDTLEKEKPVAALAGKVTQFLRAAKPYMFSSRTLQIIIGHARIDIDAGPMAKGPNFQLTGGEHLVHESNDIFQVTRSLSKTRAPLKKENGKEVLIGHAMGVKVDKTRGPGLGTRFDEIFLTGEGFCEAHTFLRRFEKDIRLISVLENNGNFYRWTDANGNAQTINGKSSLIDYFRENKDELKRLQKAFDEWTEKKEEAPEPVESIPQETEEQNSDRIQS
jgi:RecA/RadA recombinase